MSRLLLRRVRRRQTRIIWCDHHARGLCKDCLQRGGIVQQTSSFSSTKSIFRAPFDSEARGSKKEVASRKGVPRCVAKASNQWTRGLQLNQLLLESFVLGAFPIGCPIVDPIVDPMLETGPCWGGAPPGKAASGAVAPERGVIPVFWLWRAAGELTSWASATAGVTTPRSSAPIRVDNFPGIVSSLLVSFGFRARHSATYIGMRQRNSLAFAYPRAKYHAVQCVRLMCLRAIVTRRGGLCAY